MKSIIHKGDTRGHVDHGWLKTWHTFSFADYFESSRVHFGMLRVLNDDIVEPGMGFGMHPHDNMEIITIPLEGSLEHKDSMGNGSVIHAGEIQVMSAGSGIHHSEFNPSKTEAVNLLQIWVFPNVRNVTPRYDQVRIEPGDMKNRLKTIISPEKDDNTPWLHQDTWFSLGEFGSNCDFSYKLHSPDHGAYIFLISGKAEIEGIHLERRDGLGLSEILSLSGIMTEEGKILLMEVPMH